MPKYRFIVQTDMSEILDEVLRIFKDSDLYAERCFNCGNLIISRCKYVHCPTVQCGVNLILAELPRFKTPTAKLIEERINDVHDALAPLDDILPMS